MWLALASPGQPNHVGVELAAMRRDAKSGKEGKPSRSTQDQVIRSVPQQRFIK